MFLKEGDVFSTLSGIFEVNLEYMEVGQNFIVFTQEPPSATFEEIYKNHNGILVDSIARKFPHGSRITCLEAGGGSGALLQDLNTQLDGRELIATNIDLSSELLDADIFSVKKIQGRIEDMVSSQAYDLIIMRYVLNYNGIENQLAILKKVYSLLKDDGLFLLHHCGSANEKHRIKWNAVFASDVISEKLVRTDSYWSTWADVKKMLREVGFKTAEREQYTVPLGDLYKRRYDLSDSEESHLHEFLGEYDYIDFVISENSR